MSNKFNKNDLFQRWNKMKLRSQMICKLIFIIFLLVGIYITAYISILNNFYRDDVLYHFKEDLIGVHYARTS